MQVYDALCQEEPSEIVLVSHCMLVLELSDLDDDWTGGKDSGGEVNFFKIKADRSKLRPAPSSYAADL